MSAPDPIRRILAVVLWIMIACGGAFVWLFQDTPLLNRSVLSSRTLMDPRMTPDEGRAFLYPSRWFGFGDDVDRPRSGIVLHEDGVELAPARAKHDRVRGTGGGAWSHWTTSIFFSSSDGTDPRTNGRRYEIQGLTLPVRWGSLAVAIVGAFMALRAVSRLARRAPRERDASTDGRAADTPPASGAASRRTAGRRAALTAAAIVVSLLIVFVLLGVLEVILRVGAAGGPQPELRLAADIGWERAGEALRTIPSGAVDDGSALRILFTGDSFTHDKTWGDKTIAALSASGVPALGFEAGVSGYGTTQTFIQLERLLPEVKPDAVVILFYGWNDLRDNWPYPAICYNPRMTLRPYMDEGGAVHTPSALAIGIKRLELWKQVLEPALDPMRVRNANDAVATDGVDTLAASRRRVVIGYDAEPSWRPFYERSRQEGPYVTGAWSVTARAFEAIRDLCQAHGAALIVVGIDNPLTVDRDVADRWLRAGSSEVQAPGARTPNHVAAERQRDPAPEASAVDVDPDLPMRRLAQVMNELGIAFVDAVPALRARRDRLGGAKQFDGDPGNISAHLLPDAEAALAESITPMLVDVAGRAQRRR